MRIAVIGGGASGMVTAYLLDKQGHHVTVFEKQTALGGHIKTLNKNVTPNRAACPEILENGVLEFPTVFHNFCTLMQELEVELEPVNIGSALFFKDGHHFLSGATIQKNFTGIHRMLEYLQLDTLYVRSAGFWVEMQFKKTRDFYNQSMSAHLKRKNARNTWLKLLAMYSYSIPYDLINDVPAELAIPTLRDYVFVNWLRVKGGVYSYIEKILTRFKGKIYLSAKIASISRSSDAVIVKSANGDIQAFDKIVFATPPDQVLTLLADPSESERRRFSAWEANIAKTLLHTDTSMYARHGIRNLTEFDFFQTDNSWGYNASLNQLCHITSPSQYSLAFQLEPMIAEERIIHVQEHHTPRYTVDAFRYRDEVINSNGENNTYHAGAYLGDGLHEGAVTSGLRVAALLS
jgi:uncharacterized protein